MFYFANGILGVWVFGQIQVFRVLRSTSYLLIGLVWLAWFIGLYLAAVLASKPLSFSKPLTPFAVPVCTMGLGRHITQNCAALKLLTLLKLLKL
jgi:hypothetical protein